ncbi:unnamed protein product [Prunus armeniaca]
MAGAHRLSFHSPLMPNGRYPVVEFSLTSHAEWQVRGGQVFTHLSCETAGAHGMSFHSPLMPNGRHAVVEFSLTSLAEQRHAVVELSLTLGFYCHSLPIFQPPFLLGDLGDYMITIGMIK